MEDLVVVDTQKVGDYTVNVVVDPEPENPRTAWDHLGKMVAFHRRYDLGDKHDLESPEDFEFVMKHRPGPQRSVAALPLYLYDHSGLSMSTRLTGNPGWWHWQWDAGQVGFIYITRETVEKEFGWKKMTKARLEHLFSILQAEVEEYDKYLRGDVYGYVVTGPDGATVSSVWGFYDVKVAMEEGLADAQYYATPQLTAGAWTQTTSFEEVF